MDEKNNKSTGIPAGKVVIPIVIIIAILQVTVVVMILMSNSASNTMSNTMRYAGVYKQDATSLLGGSSLLSETSTNFVLMPLAENGEVNVSPLIAYANELTQDRRGDQVLQRFQTYNVPEESLEHLKLAAESTNYMLDAQLHAIALIRSIYPVPDMPALTSIPDYELTKEELNMSKDQREAIARNLILDSEYAQNKQTVSQEVSTCVDILDKTSTAYAISTTKRINIIRTVLWLATLAVIVIIAVTFFMLFTQIILPLEKFAQRIPAGLSLDEEHGSQEVRMVASAYNGVRKRRDALDTILRSAAETDALTNLPNRYRFEQFIMEAEESGCSVAMMLFDVDYLKKINDTQGHLEGDKLLCMAADCISSCFGEHCFRFGGDEFAAIIVNCTPEGIEEMVRKFEAIEHEKHISISYGYAYTEDISRTTFKKLLAEADKKMYARKQLVHASS